MWMPLRNKELRIYDKDQDGNVSYFVAFQIKYGDLTDKSAQLSEIDGGKNLKESIKQAKEDLKQATELVTVKSDPS